MQFDKKQLKFKRYRQISVNMRIRGRSTNLYNLFLQYFVQRYKVTIINDKFKISSG